MQVGAWAEGGAVAGQDDDAEVVASRERLERGVHLLDHVGRDGVAPFDAVESQVRHRAADVDLDRVIRKGVSHIGSPVVRRATAARRS